MSTYAYTYHSSVSGSRYPELIALERERATELLLNSAPGPVIGEVRWLTDRPYRYEGEGEDTHVVECGLDEATYVLHSCEVTVDD